MRDAPLLIFRVGYMETYDGAGEITSGGSHVERHGEGGEMWNFRAEGGYCYGYVMTRNFSGIDLSRLDKSRAWNNNDELKGVDVVFIARKPKVGQVIVGWYKGATIFHKQYRKRRGNKRKGDWDKLDYLCEVDRENIFLLPESERTFEVPYAPVHGKGYPGHSNVWYADSGMEKVTDFVSRVRSYIKSDKSTYNPTSAHESNFYGNGWGSLDKTLISRIEQAAIDAVWEHYENKNYSIISVEKDNRGWDLEASKGEDTLYLEVKGHLGNVIQFELTPNEYMKMQEYSSTYRVCVVRNALVSPDLVVFVPKNNKNAWCLISEKNNEQVQLAEKIAARASEVK